MPEGYHIRGGGAYRVRTGDLLRARQALSQLETLAPMALLFSGFACGSNQESSGCKKK